MDDIVKEIRHLLVDLGMTRTELADMMGVTKQHVSHCLSGPNAAFLRRCYETLKELKEKGVG